jgi:hypothetical protein
LPAFFAAFTAAMAAMPVLISWFYERTQSIALAQLIHISSTGSMVAFSPPGPSRPREKRLGTPSTPPYSGSSFCCLLSSFLTTASAANIDKVKLATSLLEGITMSEVTADLFISLDGFASGLDQPPYFGYFGPGLASWVRDHLAASCCSLPIRWPGKTPAW